MFALFIYLDSETMSKFTLNTIYKTQSIALPEAEIHRCSHCVVECLCECVCVFVFLLAADGILCRSKYYCSSQNNGGRRKREVRYRPKAYLCTQTHTLSLWPSSKMIYSICQVYFICIKQYHEFASRGFTICAINNFG